MSPHLALAAVCGPTAAAVPPGATVELRVTSVDDADAKLLEVLLRRRLTDRLLQDGHRLLPPSEEADVEVWVHLDETGARVEAQGDAPRSETIAAGDPELVILETLQLTTTLVDEVQPSETTSVRAVSLEGEAPEPQWRERLQVGLLERGFGLTTRPTAADLRLCVATEGELTTVHATSGASTCEDAASTQLVPRGDTAERSSVLLLDAAARVLGQRQVSDQIAVVEALTAVASVPRPEGRRPPESSPTEPAPAFAVGSERPAPPLPPAEGSVAVSAHGGVVGRTGGVDGIVGLRVRAGRRRGLGGGVELLVVPSSAENLSIVEVVPAGLFDWRVGVGRRGQVALGTFAGLHIHDYRWDLPGGGGRRLAPSVGTTIRLGMLGRRGLLAFGGLRAGWSGGRWVHVLDGRTSWRRSALLIGIEAGVGWDIAWGRRR